MANSIADRVWQYLSDAEQAERDIWLRDDLKIAKLCVLEAERGTPDPWGTAFWKCMCPNDPLCSCLGEVDESSSGARHRLSRLLR